MLDRLKLIDVLPDEARCFDRTHSQDYSTREPNLPLCIPPRGTPQGRRDHTSGRDHLPVSAKPQFELARVSMLLPPTINTHSRILFTPLNRENDTSPSHPNGDVLNYLDSAVPSGSRHKTGQLRWKPSSEQVSSVSESFTSWR